jgi:hypothetical protein
MMAIDADGVSDPAFLTTGLYRSRSGVSHSEGDLGEGSM